MGNVFGGFKRSFSNSSKTLGCIVLANAIKKALKCKKLRFYLVVCSLIRTFAPAFSESTTIFRVMVN